MPLVHAGAWEVQSLEATIAKVRGRSGTLAAQLRKLDDLLDDLLTKVANCGEHPEEVHSIRREAGEKAIDFLEAFEAHPSASDPDWQLDPVGLGIFASAEPADKLGKYPEFKRWCPG
ncbi:unnamed protein product [Symbiodinium sp. CCMP2592]|nr:unnamed protein product [Symbiodinium sp. CCMP2592]